jgi:Tfp pilus assembly protein PilV
MTHLPAQKNKGFSLLETLLAIAILMIAVVGPMSLAWAALATANDEKNETIAAYLAQEAIEYVKNVRDTNTLGGVNSWLYIGPGATFDNTCGTSVSTACGIDVNDRKIAACSALNSQSPCTLKINNFGVYGYVTGNNSIFTRRVSVSLVKGGHNDERLITVTVSWKNRTLNRDLTVTNVMYNYQQ